MVDQNSEEAVLVEASSEPQEMPIMHSSKPKESDSIKTIPNPKGKIDVEALRPGFFQNCRKVEGDKFSVSDMSKVGSWMKCVDPQLEKQHQVMIKEAKEKEKEQAGK